MAGESFEVHKARQQSETGSLKIDFSEPVCEHNELYWIGATAHKAYER